MPRLSRRAGLSLLELMVAISIGGFVALLVSQVVSSTRKTFQQLTYTRIMKNIAAAAQDAVQNPEVLLFTSSLRYNYDLEKCIWPKAESAGSTATTGMAPNCSATDPERQKSIELFQAPRDRKFFKPDPARIAGSDSKPAWYDRNGVRGCNPADTNPDAEKCYFKVVAYFWATCPQDAVSFKQQGGVGGTNLARSCNRAETLNFRFQVSYHPPEDPSAEISSSLTIASVPADDVFWQGGLPGGLHTSNFAVPIGTSIFSSRDTSPWSKHNTCPNNFSLIEIVDGKPRCECLLPFKKVDASTCELVDNKCPPEKRYKGTSLAGAPICVDVKCPYRDIVISNQRTFDFSCPPPSWLNKIEILPSAKATDCVCITQYSFPVIEGKQWKYGCHLRCPLRITCCHEE